MKLMPLDAIRKALSLERAIALQEEGFRLYTEGKVMMPPVGYMDLGCARGEVHVKTGWIQDDSLFVVKIAGAYPQNPGRGLPTVQGAMVVMNAETGQPEAFLQDEGYLTNWRTAIAGLIAAKYLGPKKIDAIGIVGTGTQARLQLEMLKQLTDCRTVWVWGRHPQQVKAYQQEMEAQGWNIHAAASVSQICQECRLIVTTTPSRAPLITSKDVRPATHITAVGADAPGKQELDPLIFQRADLCVVDSHAQCIDHGESCHPIQAGIIAPADLIELGAIIANPSLGRTSDAQITIADLTGIAVQDIQIAKAVLRTS